MSEWTDTLKSIAPTVASALLGPLGGVAVEVLGGVLGADTKAIQKTITDGKMTSDQLVAIQQAELNLKAMEAERGFKFAELEFQNTDSARKMQIATNSWIPGALAVGVTFGFFGILLFMLIGQYRPTEPLLIMLGALGTAWGSVINFYFGSSHGSQQKSELLANSVAK